MPSGEKSDKELRLADCVEGQLLEMVSRPLESNQGVAEFPNILQAFLPVSLCVKAKEKWQRIFALRVEWIAKTAGPEHYPHIQGMASRDQWERQFVFECNELKCRGVDLVGLEVMLRLLDIGRMLEARHPVLARDACSPLGM
jgi:hypothetical protein